MDLTEELKKLAKKIETKSQSFATEEATKMGLIVPFIRALGYDVFDTAEVCPEYVATTSDKKDQRVDYAILKDDVPIILIECKALGTQLEVGQADQLRKYFGNGKFKAPVAILTDGNTYKFYTDLMKENVMDRTPYMTFTLTDMNKRLIAEIQKLGKENFNPDEAVSAAEKLKYMGLFKKFFSENIEEPKDDLVKFFIANSDFEANRITSKYIEKFRPILKEAITSYIADRITEKFAQAMAETKKEQDAKEQETNNLEAQEEEIVTTQEEIQGLYIVKSILTGIVQPERISLRDKQTRCLILFDDNIRKPLIKFYFESPEKMEVEIVKVDKSVERHEIAKLDDIYKFSEEIKARALAYLEQNND